MNTAYLFNCPNYLQRISSEENVEGRAVECPSCPLHFIATLEQDSIPVPLGPPKVLHRVSTRKALPTRPRWLWPSVAGLAAMIIVGFLLTAADVREVKTKSFSRGLD